MLKSIKDYLRMHKLRLLMTAINCLIATVPVILFGIIINSVTLNWNIEKTTKSIDADFNRMNVQMNDYFEDIRQISKVVFFDDKVMQILREDPKLENRDNVFLLRNYLSSEMQINLSIRDIYVITEESRQAGTSDLALGEELINLFEEEASLGKDDKDFEVIVPQILLNDDSCLVAKQHIRYKDTLKYAGSGAIILDKDDFVKSVQSDSDIKEMQIFVSDNTGKIIAASEDVDYNLLGYLSDNPINDNGFFEIEGKQYLFRTGSLSNLQWKITALLPASVFYDEIYWLKSIIIWIIILMLLATITVTLFYNHSIGKYITVLTDAFSNVAFKNLNVRLDIGKGNEMEYVSNGFNEMINEIKTLTKRQLETQQRLYEAELQKTGAELYALQSQINSHFLYNALACVRGMANKGETQAVDKMISEIVLILRYATDEREFVTLADELENIKNYIEIQNIMSKNINCVFDAEESAKKCCVHKLILQPIIENSILHGFSNKSKGTVRISAKTEDDVLTVKIYDNGCGIEDDKVRLINDALAVGEDTYQQEKPHIGLINIQKRIRIAFGKEYGIYIKSKAGTGTLLVVKLPVKGQLTNV